MTVKSRYVDYDHNGKTLQGLLAWNEVQNAKRPAVIVSHAWAGRGDFENEVARKLAGLGYAGFALDLYGKGILGQSTEENQALMPPFMEDRALLQSRLLEAVDVVKSLDEVDENRVVAIGYCFGGLCVLDIARTGASLKGLAWK